MVVLGDAVAVVVWVISQNTDVRWVMMMMDVRWWVLFDYSI